MYAKISVALSVCFSIHSPIDCWRFKQKCGQFLLEPVDFIGINSSFAA